MFMDLCSVQVREDTFHSWLLKAPRCYLLSAAGLKCFDTEIFLIKLVIMAQNSPKVPKLPDLDLSSAHQGL